MTTKRGTHNEFYHEGVDIRIQAPITSFFRAQKHDGTNVYNRLKPIHSETDHVDVEAACSVFAAQSALEFRTRTRPQESTEFIAQLEAQWQEKQSKQV
jgi:hypothetical protein